jgi:hypothetical protein
MDLLQQQTSSGQEARRRHQLQEAFVERPQQHEDLDFSPRFLDLRD